jgi:AGCS family alanine or glycine:cation symporter
MTAIFDAINRIFSFIVPLADFLWEFPTNFEAYRRIPVLGNLTFAVILLLGSGVYFTIRTGAIQVTQFKSGIKTLTQKRSSEIGISPLAAFFLSSAMRVGPGNIVGVTGAISVGGPGALFWMWVSAFFGMAIAYMEAVLAQIFKEKKGNEFVGGLPFYGRRILGNRKFVGVVLSCVFIIYAFFCIPAQAFNVFSSVGQTATIITGNTYGTQSNLYYAIAVVLIVVTAIIAFGGIKKVTKMTDKVVPVMAIIYCATILLLIFLNLDTVPYFFKSVFGGAFKPEAIFGGAMGTVLAQGIKRGLMSNEAGQGTITMSAAASDASHPCEQGNVQSIGVFLDTMVICTLSGFVVVMAHAWTGDTMIPWEALKDQKLSLFLTSLGHLTPNASMSNITVFIITICYGLFAYTTLIGMIVFAEIAANRISKSKTFITTIRMIGALIFVPFGAFSLIAGLELGNLWYISDLGNIIIVFFNLPLLYLGAKYALRATKHYKAKDGTPFNSQVAGTSVEYWDNRSSNSK